MDFKCCTEINEKQKSQLCQRDLEYVDCIENKVISSPICKGIIILGGEWGEVCGVFELNIIFKYQSVIKIKLSHAK